MSALPLRFRGGRVGDHSLIYSNWIEQERMVEPNQSLPKREFAERMRGVIASVLKRAQILVAHDIEDANGEQILL